MTGRGGDASAVTEHGDVYPPSLRNVDLFVGRGRNALPRILLGEASLGP
jgi:hypothetical protein